MSTYDFFDTVMAIDVAKRGKIIALVAEGIKTKTDIARECNVTRQSVYNIYNAYLRDPNRNIPVAKKPPGPRMRMTMGHLGKISIKYKVS